MTEVEPDRDALLAHKKSSEFIDQNNAAAIDYAGAALRSLILVNGGAVVAILGFLAAIGSDGVWAGFQIVNVTSALTSYAYGAAASVATLGLSYFVSLLNVELEISKLRIWQHPYVIDGEKTKVLYRVTVVVHVLAVFLAFLSLFLFMRGISFTAAAFTQAG